MIKQQADVLRQKERQLEEQLQKFDIEQKDLQAREARVEKQEKLLSERAAKLEKVYPASMATSISPFSF